MSNVELLKAIDKQDPKAVLATLSEDTAPHGLVADTNAKMMDQSTPLHNAVQNGNLEIIDILLKHFAEVNAQDEVGICPLHLAVAKGNIDIVKRILGKPEALVELQDSQGSTPAHLAAEKLYDEILMLLVKRRPSVTTVKNNAEKTCLEILQSKGAQAGQQKKVYTLME
jgi:ankyrin repeat protein